MSTTEEFWKVGDRCHAKWSDESYYPAEILEIKEASANGVRNVLVSFYQYGDVVEVDYTHLADSAYFETTPAVDGSTTPEVERNRSGSIVDTDPEFSITEMDDEDYATLAQLTRQQGVSDEDTAGEEEKAAEDLSFSQHYYNQVYQQPQADPYHNKPSTMKKRDRVVHEIVTSEESYVNNLQVLVIDIIQPLQRSITTEDPLLTKELMNDLFSNIETIFNMNKKFHGDLHQVLLAWDDAKCIGDLFVEIAPFFKLYTQYVNNHMKAVKVLAEVLQNKKFAKLQKFLEDLRNRRLNMQELSSYLIMPIQRIPRYKLLLEELVKNTDDEHPDKQNLLRAVSQVSAVAAHINKCVHQHQNQEKIAQIQGQFVGKRNLLAAGREFIKQGPLVKKGTKRDQRYEFFLFNDILIYASQSNMTLKRSMSRKYKPHRTIQVDYMFSVYDLQDEEGEDKHRILVMNSSKPFVVYAETAQEKEAWIEAFKQQTEKLKKVIHRRTQSESIESQLVELPDEAIGLVACSACSSKFTSYGSKGVRCRYCEKLCCTSCTKFKMKKSVAGTASGAEEEQAWRICDSCVHQLMTKYSSAAYKDRRPSIELIDPPAEQSSTLGARPRTRASTLTRKSRLANRATMAHNYMKDLETMSKTAKVAAVVEKKGKGLSYKQVQADLKRSLSSKKATRRGDVTETAAAKGPPSLAKQLSGVKLRNGADRDVPQVVSVGSNFGDELRNKLRHRHTIANMSGDSKRTASRLPPAISEKPVPEEVNSAISPAILAHIQKMKEKRQRRQNSSGSNPEAPKKGPDRLEEIAERKTLTKDDLQQLNTTPKKRSPPPLPATSPNPPVTTPKRPPPRHNREASLSDVLRSKLPTRTIETALLQPWFTWKSTVAADVGTSVFEGVTLQADVGQLKKGHECEKLIVDLDSCTFKLESSGSTVATGKLQLTLADVN